MKKLRTWMFRLAGLFSKTNHEQDLAAEIESHLQLHIDDNIRVGMKPDEARREAILKLGGVEPTKQACRESSTIPFIESLVQDIRFSLRQLGKYPGFTCTVLLMLALGMGVCVAIFSFVDAALIKPLPYRDPARLVYVTESAGKLIPRANLSYLDYLDWKKQNKVFSSMDVFTGTGYMMRTPAGTQLVEGARVSDGFFHTLGIKPILGRDFRAGEDLKGAADVVIISYGAWQTFFGSRKDIIGQTVDLSGVSNTIIGVLPQDFHFAPRGLVRVWATLHNLNPCETRRSCHNLVGVGRLNDGVSYATALVDMQTIAKQLEIQYPDSNRDQGATVLPLAEVITGDIRPVLLALLGAAGLLLLIAYVNVSSLLLVRSESRKREIAVRGALGASPVRLIRQFVTEGLALVAIGSALGLAIADGAVHALLALIPKDLMGYVPFLEGVSMNLRVLAFAASISLLGALLFAFTPALRLSPAKMRDGLAEGSRGSAGTLWRRLGANLVVLELAIAVVLLVSAGLLGKSLYRLLHVELGFEPDHLATMQVALPELAYPKDEQITAVQKQILERISTLPGVKSAAISNILPVSFNGNTNWIRFVGKPFHGEHNEVNSRDVGAGYFSTIHATLASGRFFTETDDKSKPSVTIINQKLAKLYFPGEDPIGKKIGDTELTPKSLREIVGVVNDLKEGSLDSEIWPAEYFPINQNGDSYFALVVKTSQDEASVLQSINAIIHQIDPGIGTLNPATMLEHINLSQTAYLHRSSAWLVGTFAALALLLGVVGLYGVIAYSVSQRTREIGVRMALGAQRSAVYGLVLKEAGVLTGIGIVLGLGCSVATAMVIRNLLFGTQAWDISTLAEVAVVLAASALLASFVPAHRAASVDPVQALRAE